MPSKHLTTMRVELWKLQVLRASKVPLGVVFDDGFKVRFQQILQGGKLTSKELEMIREIKKKEIKDRQEELALIENLLDGKLGEEIKAKKKSQDLQDIIVETLGKISTWKKKLPEFDRDAIYYPDWEEIAGKVSSQSGEKIQISELQDFARKELNKE